MLAKSVPAVMGGTTDELVTIEAMDDEVDSLYASIVGYLGKLGADRIRQLLAHHHEAAGE